MTVTRRRDSATGRQQTTGKQTTSGPGGGGSRPPRGRGPAAGRDAKYQLLADALRDQISTGALPPGSLLPSETELINGYGISRSTARAAIDLLRNEGLIVVHMGRGAYVRRDADRPAHTHTRGINRTAKGGYADATETDQWREVAEPEIPAGVGGTFRTDATPDLALSLGVPETTPVFIYERLLTGPAGRRMLHRLYVPITVVAETPALTDDPFRTPADLYRVLDKAGHTLGWSENVRARMPSPTDTTALRIPDATPLLVTRRTTVDTHTGRPLALEEVRVSAEDTQLAYAITPTTH